MKSSFKSRLKRWLGYFTAVLMILQLIDFIVVIHEFFEIRIHGLGEPAGMVISLLLTLWIFRRFLIEEFELSEFDSSILLLLFLLFNLNFLLRIVVNEELLRELSEALNIIPVLVLALIPVYMFFRGDIRKYVDVIVFAIIVVYPLSQLYTMVLKKFVAIGVSIYVVYIFFTMIRQRETRFREAFKKLIEFDEVAVHWIHRLGIKNKEFYYIYLIIWLFIVSDVIIFLLPEFFGLWEHTHYHELIGFEKSVEKIESAFILSALFFILVVSYPVIEGSLRKAKLMTPIFILFLLYPTIILSPITETGVYGVKMSVGNLINAPLSSLLTPFALFLAIVFFLFLIKLNFETETGILLRSIVLGVSFSYILVFLYSIYYQAVLTHFSMPNTILLIFLMGFFLFSIIYLPYISLTEIRNLKLNFSAEVLFLLLFALLLSYLPSVYITLSFAIYSIFFVLREIKPERFLFLLYVLLLIFNYYLVFLTLIFFAYGLFSDLRRFSLRYVRVYALIPVFTGLSLIVGEIIPFDFTLTGIVYLIVMSAGEEVVFKRFLFDNMDENAGMLTVPVAFTTIHILSSGVLSYYLESLMLPLFLAYIFSYQYVTLRMYRERRNLIPFMIVHICINVFSLLISSSLRWL